MGSIGVSKKTRGAEGRVRELVSVVELGPLLSDPMIGHCLVSLIVESSGLYYICMDTRSIYREPVFRVGQELGVQRVSKKAGTRSKLVKARNVYPDYYSIRQI